MWNTILYIFVIFFQASWNQHFWNQWFSAWRIMMFFQSSEASLAFSPPKWYLFQRIFVCGDLPKETRLGFDDWWLVLFIVYHIYIYTLANLAMALWLVLFVCFYFQMALWLTIWKKKHMLASLDLVSIFHLEANLEVERIERCNNLFFQGCDFPKDLDRFSRKKEIKWRFFLGW